MKRAERLHALSEMLRRSGRPGCTAERLAEEFGVSVRTVKRDLVALENAGLPMWSRPGPGGGYGVVPGGTLPPITLSPAEATALLASVAAAPDAPYADLAAAAVRKIVDVLDPATRHRTELLAGRIWVDPGPMAPRPVRSALEQAMTDQRVLRIQYRDGTGTVSRRDVEPILFASTSGQWYLVAWCRRREAVRWFMIGRVEKAAVTVDECSGHTIDDVGEPPLSARSAAP